MESGKVRPTHNKAKLRTMMEDGTPRLHPNTVADIVGSAAEVCAMAKSDGVTTHNPPRMPYISGITAPDDRDPKGRYLSFKEIDALIDACRRPHMQDLLLLDLGCGGRIGAVASVTGKKTKMDLGVIDLLGDGEIDSNKRKPIVPITGPMPRILNRLIEQHGDGYLIWE